MKCLILILSIIFHSKKKCDSIKLFFFSNVKLDFEKDLTFSLLYLYQKFTSYRNASFIIRVRWGKVGNFQK